MKAPAHTDSEFLRELPIDPFGSMPNWASRIPGLGGTDPAPDPAYVCRTVEVRPALGLVTFTVQFQDLVATRGTLLLEVRAVSAFPGAASSRIEALSIPLDELSASRGLVQVEIASRRNTLYAIAASIRDDTDVTATGISIAVDRRATPSEHGRGWGGRPRLRALGGSGIEGAMISSWLTNLDPPSFDSPMSQLWTQRQCRSPAFHQRVRELALNDWEPYEAWRMAYVLQCLDSYGALSGNSSGLGFLTGTGSLPALLAARGCEILATDHVPNEEAAVDPGLALEKLCRPELCDFNEFFDHVHFTTLDLCRIPATFFDQFDFLWSIGADKLLDAEKFTHFVVASISCLKPGGIAVHVFDYEANPELHQSTLGLSRWQIERVVLNVLSHHNDAAQLKFRSGEPASVATGGRPFGVVFQRGRPS